MNSPTLMFAMIRGGHSIFEKIEVTNTAAFQVEVGTKLQQNRNRVASWHQGTNGRSFSIYSIKTPVGGNELVVKVSGWSRFAHISLFPVSQVYAILFASSFSWPFCQILPLWLHPPEHI